MNRWIGFTISALLIGLPACGGSSGDDANSLTNNGNNANNTPIEVTERDGIPSDDFADLLHYYFSTQEDGPGLYAYRPANPDDAPVLVDGNVPMTGPFSITMPIAENEGGSSFHLRPKGIFYQSADAFPPVQGELPAVKGYLLTTDPSQLDGEPQQISNFDYPGTFQGTGAYVAHGADLFTSSLWISVLNTRFDMDMTADEAPLELPEDGALIGTMLGDGTNSHDHWLYIDEDGSLKFYDTEFMTSSPVNDEDSGMPIVNLQKASISAGAFVSHLDTQTALVVLVDADTEGGLGKLYRVNRPTAAGDGVAKLLTNAEGEPIEFSLATGGILGGGPPGEANRWNDSEAFYFVEGASILDSERPARLVRVTHDGWSALEIGSDILTAFLPSVFVRVDGGFYWAPGLKGELIYPNNDDPSSWERRPLEDMPQSNETRIYSSAGDWIYYQDPDDAAIAYNVTSGDVVSFPESTWVGASFISNIGDEVTAELISRMELATVLVHLSGNRLGAVEAANPQDGVVILGDLPATTEEVAVNGPAIGPARLLRVEHEDGGMEVIAIDTREAGSLRRIMEAPAVEWSYDNFIGETPIPIDVSPGWTAPLKMF